MINEYDDDYIDEEFEAFKKGLMGNLGPLEGSIKDEDIINKSKKVKKPKKTTNSKKAKSNKSKKNSFPNTDLLTQWTYCRSCYKAKLPLPGVHKDEYLFCGKIGKYLKLDEIKLAKVFCLKGN